MRQLQRGLHRERGKAMGTRTRTTVWMTVILVLIVAAASSAAAGDNKSIVGTIARMDQNSVEITTRGGRTAAVKLGANTTYRKWIASKVWRLDADRSVLRVGSVVSVELSSKDPAVASVIHVR